jgi:hypothetical protein
MGVSNFWIQLVFQRSYGPKPITNTIGWFSNNLTKNQNGGLTTMGKYFENLTAINFREISLTLKNSRDWFIDDELVKIGFQVKSEMTKTLCGVVLPITKQSQKSESCLFKWLQMVWSPVTAPDPDQGFTGVTTF